MIISTPLGSLTNGKDSTSMTTLEAQAMITDTIISTITQNSTTITFMILTLPRDGTSLTRKNTMFRSLLMLFQNYRKNQSLRRLRNPKPTTESLSIWSITSLANTNHTDTTIIDLVTLLLLHQRCSTLLASILHLFTMTLASSLNTGLTMVIIITAIMVIEPTTKVTSPPIGELFNSN